MTEVGMQGNVEKTDYSINRDSTIGCPRRKKTNIDHTQNQF